MMEEKGTRASRAMLLARCWESEKDGIQTMNDLALDLSSAPNSRAFIEIYRCIEQNKKNLNLNRFELDSLPPEIERLAQLSSLKRLDISQNSFSSLPPYIGKLISLQELKLCLNLRIPFEIPPEIGQLTNLVHLKLSGNSLTAIPAEITNLKELKMLDISNNNLKELPTDISKLEKLLKLKLDNNQLKFLPNNFPVLLQHLSVSFNHEITTNEGWMTSVGKCLHLRNLELRGCAIDKWPDILRKLPQLIELDVGDNLIPFLPDADSVSNLKSLTKLLLDNNKLTTLPQAIGSLTNLIVLDLKKNPIVELPLSFRFLTELGREFQMDLDNIRMPPKEIGLQGVAAIREFLNSLMKGSVPCYRMKLLLVGQENVGKTSLLRRLKGVVPSSKGVLAKRKSRILISELESKNISTDGIDIEQLNIEGKNQDTGEKHNILFSAWDFAGQEIYYTTHQFFLTERSIFLVVWDLRSDVQTTSRIEFWLQSIKIRAGINCPVLLVGTHADDKRFKEGDALKERLELVASEFVPKFPNIKVVTAVSCLDGGGIDELKDDLANFALQQKHMGEILPATYMLLEEALGRAKEKKRTMKIPPILQWTEYQELAAGCHIVSNDALVVATSFLHDLGVLLHYNDTGNLETGLQGMVVVDPQWLVDMMASLITTKHNFTKDGILRHSDLPQIWKPPMFPLDLHDACLALLRKFGISYPVEKHKDIIPCLLPEERPDISLLWLDFDRSRAHFSRIWEFKFVPLGLFNHLLIRLMNLAVVHRYWRNGVVLSLEDDWALCEILPFRRQLSVQVRSSAARSNMLQMVVQIVEQLLANWFKCPVTRYVACTHCILNGSYDPWLFNLSECEQAALDEKVFVVCLRKKTRPVHVRLDRIVPDLVLKEFSKFKIPFNEIDISEKKIAEGAYGILYKGWWKGKVVAVKVLRQEAGMLEDERLTVFEEFRREVAIMSELHHPNLVRLEGFCHGNGVVAMVMEWMGSGDLYNFIHSDKEYTTKTALKVAFDIANGMAFLHGLSPPVVHRDLKPPNILLTEVYEGGDAVIAKIADFGLSAKQYIHSFSERAVETPTWLAPEILKDGCYTEKSDVYSFGILAYELFTRKRPFEGMNFHFWSQLEQLIIQGRRPSVDSLRASLPEMADIVEECWSHTSSERPTFENIRQRILSITKKYVPDLYQQLEAEAEEYLQGLNGLQERKKESFDSSSLTEDGEDYHVIAGVEGKFIKRLITSPPDPVFCLLLVKNQVWSGHRSGDIRIWSAESGQLVDTIRGAHSKEIRDMIMVNDNVWSASRDGNIKIWRTPQHDRELFPENKVEKEGDMYPEEGVKKHYKLMANDKEFDGVSLQGSVVTVDKDSAASARKGFTIFASNTIYTNFCQTIEERDSWIRALGVVIERLQSKGDVRFMNKIKRENEEFNCLILLSSGRVISGGNDLIVRLWNPDTLKCESERLLTDTIWQSGMIQPTKRRPREASLIKRVFSATEGEIPKTTAVVASATLTEPISTAEPAPSSSTAPEGSPVYSASFSGVSASERSITDPQRFSIVPAKKGEIAGDKRRTTFQETNSSPDLPLHVLQNCEGHSRMSLQYSSNKFVWRMVLHRNYVWVIAHRFIFCLDLKSLRIVKKLEGHMDLVNCIIGVENRIWSAGMDKKVFAWDVESGTIVKEIACENIATSLVFVGEEVWCGERDCISIWNKEGQLIRTLKHRHTDQIRAMILVWGRIIWSGSLDKSICLWS